MSVQNRPRGYVWFYACLAWTGFHPCDEHECVCTDELIFQKTGSATALGGNVFQWPAFSATISTMIPKEQYGRANGMMALMEMGPGVFAPGGLSALFEWLVPPGPGIGWDYSSFSAVLAGLAGYIIYPIPNAEYILPDHDAVPVGEPA